MFIKVYLNQHPKKDLNNGKRFFTKVLATLFKHLKTLGTFSNKGGS